MEKEFKSPCNKERELQKSQTKRRHDAVRARFSELNSLRVEGLKPSYESILERLSEEFFYTVQTVQNILKRK